MTLGFKHVPAAIAGNVMLLTVPFMYLSGILFFNETLNLASAVGAIITLFSIAVIVRNR